MKAASAVQISIAVRWFGRRNGMRSRAAVLLFTGSIIGVAGIALLSNSRRPPTRSSELPTAWHCLQFGEFDRAVHQFQSIAETSTDNAERQQALYGLALVYHLRRPDADPAKAAGLFDQALRLSPDSVVAAWCRLGRVRVDHLTPSAGTPDYAAVRAAYQAIIDTTPDHPAAREAFLYQQATLLLGNADEARSAVSSLDAYLSRHADSSLRPAVYGLRATAHSILQDGDAELTDRLAALKASLEIDGGRASDLSATYWQIAVTADFAAGDLDIARTYYRRLVDEYPTDPRVFMAKQSIARLDAMEQSFAAGGLP